MLLSFFHRKTKHRKEMKIKGKREHFFHKIVVVVSHEFSPCWHANQNNDLNDSIIIKANYMYCKIKDISRWLCLFHSTTISCQIYYYWPRSISHNRYAHVSSVNTYMSNLILVLTTSIDHMKLVPVNN